MPPDSTTKQTLELPGRTLSFTATAGSIRLFDDKGEAQADIAYTAYQLDGTDRASRPVTFLFNGGPGSASAWLQLGNNGPWRLAINADEVTPSTSPDLQPNAETWLDFTDLVFIDPVGTGYSRFVAQGDDVRKRLLDELASDVSIDSSADPAAVILVGGVGPMRTVPDGVPVSTVALSETPVPDLRIVAAPDPSPVPVGWAATFTATVEGRGLAGKTSRLVLEDRGAELVHVDMKWSSDEERAIKVAEQLDVGMANVNTPAGEGADVPFGGTKRSGFGRELGPLGIDEFVNKRLFYVQR